MKKMYLFLMLTITVSLGSFAQNPDGGAGCMDEAACNYCPWATIESNTCDYTCIGCMDATACNYNPDADMSGEIECDFSCWGCMDENACNWDETATIDDGCSYACIGCMDEGACNFDSEATWDLSDLGASDNYDICDYSCVGCTDPNACDYNIDATIPTDCDYDSCSGCMVEGACDYDPDAIIPDYCDYDSCTGCFQEDACNYNVCADADGNPIDCTIACTDCCDYDSCAGCLDPTSCNYAIEDFEGAFDETGSPDEFIAAMVTDLTGEENEFDECMTNIDPLTIDWTGSPIAMIDSLDADGNSVLDLTGSDQEYIVLLDINGNWILNTAGCPDPVDFTGEPNATDLVWTWTGEWVEDESGEWMVYEWVEQDNPGYNPNWGGPNPDYDPNVFCGEFLFEENPDYNPNYGNVIMVDNPDYNPNYGIGDQAPGWCLNPEYNANYGGEIMGEIANPDYNPNYGDAIGDGIPDFYVYGNAELCDYSCWDCANVAWGESTLDNCGVCDDNEDNDDESCTGSLIPGSCNYLEGATIVLPPDWDSCMGCMDNTACNYCFDCTIPFSDPLTGSCDYEACDGCTDPAYMEYNELNPATQDDGCLDLDGSEFEFVALVDDAGDPVLDIDGNGIVIPNIDYNPNYGMPTSCCETLYVYGCTTEGFVEYNASANTDDGSCLTEIIEGCSDSSACNYDPLVNSPNNAEDCDYGDDTADCVGCMNPIACDYNPNATIQSLNEVFDVDGNTIGYTDACDYTSCAGCTDVNACNFGYTTQSDDYSDDMLVDVDGGVDMTGSPDEFIPSLDADGNVEYDLTGSEDETYTIWYAYDDGEPYAIIYTNDDYNDNYGDMIMVANPDYNPDYGVGVTGDGEWDNGIEFLDDGSCEYTSCEGCMVMGACDYDADATIAGDCDLSCLGCMDSDACNFLNTATTDDGTCDYACIGCMVELACNFEVSYTIADNTTCTYDCHGCMQTDACNYDEAATYEPQGTCEWTSCMGCMDITSCDYDPDASIPDPAGCDYTIVDCFGCADEGACNTLDATWVIDNGSCDYSCLGCTDNGFLLEEQGQTIIVEGEEFPVYATDVDGNPILDVDGNPIQQTEWVNVSENEGSLACNYDPTATIDDGSCDYSCTGCTDAVACNYDPTATIPTECDYSLVDCAGCTAPEACNYNPNATIDLTDGVVGSCEYTSCAGCMDVVGCDYDETATISVDCDYTCWGCTDEMACNYDADSTIDDGTCSYVCVGCTDAGACNYEGAIIDDGSCDYSCVGCMDMLGCDYDADFTIAGECDWSCWGCMDPLACNYCEDCINPNDSCDYDECSGCMDPTSCDYNPNAVVSIPEDCVDWSSCVGCLETGMYYESGYWTPFTNYCETCTMDTYGNGYTQDNNSASTNEFFAGDVVECIPLLSECGMCADGTLDCFNEIDWSGDPDEFVPCTDEDGVVIVIVNEETGEEEVVWCDNEDYNPNYGELVGCMDWYAVNYDENATAHDAEMCLYYIEGCMDDTACNYDMEATQHMPDWCIYVDGICETCSGEMDGTGTIVDNDADDDTVCDVDDVCPGEGYSEETDDTIDTDGDLIPDGCDTCPNDAENDADGDGLCGDVDPCDYDAENDADGDGICGNIDDCPYDAENDADGDGICGDVDDCPYDEFNDADGDGVCGDVDACEGFDDAEDADGDGVPDACEVPGCTDAGYANYNPEATDDDGSCEVLCGCNTEDGYGLYGLAYSGTLDNAFTITNSAGDVVLSADFWVGESGYVNYCWPADDCYTVSVDGNTDAIGWNVYECLDCGLDGDCENNELYVVASSQGTSDYEFGTCIDGCTDETACNYNEEANSEDGSCCLVCGCTDETADNYSVNACFDDGSCEYWGCTDETALNYDETANVDDGSCYFVAGCTDDTACNYDDTADFDDGSCEYARVWFLDVNADGCGNVCAGDVLGIDGSVSVCSEDLPVLDIAGWPNATWADNDDCHGESIVNADGVLEHHWCIGLEESISGLSIYPNPASDVLNIEFNSNSNDNVTVEFVNAIGQVISSDKFEVTNGLLDIELDMNGYSKGVYQINLISNTDILSRTIMVE